VILRRIHQDARYGGVLTSLVAEISILAGVDIAQMFYDPTMTIFVTSPGQSRNTTWMGRQIFWRNFTAI
jgi:hypothetical protein